MATRKVRTSPRKRPTQDRSKQTVDTIVEATARVLVSEGYERATTNRVAEVAGVSVGSLYQYFPSKESLVAAVVDRHSDHMMCVFREAIAGAATLPLREGARVVITAMVDGHDVEPELHRVCAEQIPRVGRLGRLLEDLDTHASPSLVAYLQSRAHELVVKDIELATFVLVHSVETVLHRVLSTRRVVPRDVLIDELTALCLRYLTATAPDEPARAQRTVRS
ncbi:MAG: TetR/AcrR family transcriptional regulator [Myxococcales bacterium]|nr:TetR/AcrR family transcriptional regulator [Myxococcales bacterium]